MCSLKIFGHKWAAAAAVIYLISGAAFAVPISCPGSAATTDREFTVDPGGTCYAYGPGNTNAQNPSFATQVLDQGWSFIEKDEDGANSNGGFLNIAGLNLTSGTFDISASIFAQFDDLLLIFKSGEGQADPDWAAFLYADAASGTWSIVSPGPGQQALSHAEIYGKGTPVPEPASLVLLALGLLGFAVARRRRA